MNADEPLSPYSIKDKDDMKKLSDELVLSLVHTLSQISEHNKTSGIPPPKDFEESYISGSFVSNDSSLFSDEISALSDVSEIREKNQELKKTVKRAVTAFKATSKEFLSRSILTSDKKNLLITELENVKNILVGAIEEQKERSFSMPNDRPEDNKAQIVHDQINQIQKDIQEASKRLADTENQLRIADAETAGLEHRLNELDRSLHEVDVNEIDEEGWCRCVVG